ncbi:hypothetical protein DM02DRAFT_678731 [Periconia macrospinosa]|uniref:Uncharacterized protein n=1 Tax=Periconia macrospinosa TaxID=97972 RepID=A0A2V1CX36_9PLEO|nr:hypothetical protein DM02DRAFT_678731 [Periconia macrospinosa]
MEIYSLECWTTRGLKDSDYNWLYGPLRSSSKSSLSAFISKPTTAVSKPTCFLNKKSILKKRSISELIRQKLMSALPVLKRAGGVQVQYGNASVDRTRDYPMFDRTATDSIICLTRWKSVSGVATDCFSPPRTPGSQSLGQGERKLLRFDERVEQFRAVDLENAERDWSAQSDDDSSDDGLLMKFPLKERAFLLNNTENNPSTDGKIIEMLPPTTLRSRSPPPRKTLGRSHPSTNSLIDEEDDTEMFSIQLSKCSEAPDDFFAIHDGRAKDISLPFKDNQDDTIGARPVNELTNIVHKGKDIAQAIWKEGWLQLLERVLIQCQSILLALLGAGTQVLLPHAREAMSHVAGDEDMLNQARLIKRRMVPLAQKRVQSSGES